MYDKLIEQIEKEIQDILEFSKHYNLPITQYDSGTYNGLIKAKEIILAAQKEQPKTSKCIVCGKPAMENDVYCSTLCREIKRGTFNKDIPDAPEEDEMGPYDWDQFYSKNQ